jgi:LCP family protein required for cell wall assembly
MPDLLDQLDDPVPFTASPELIGAVRARGRHLRRRRRVTLFAAAIPLVLVLALVAGAAYVDRRTDGVTRLDVAAGVLAMPAAGQPYDILLVGTDGPDPSGLTTPRSDLQMVVHIDPLAGTVRVLSVPRDLVPADATSAGDRLNETFSRGGPEGLIRAIHDDLGIEIAHYVAVDFQGFARLVNLTGAVSVRSSMPLRDLLTGLDLDTSCQRLDGVQTLGLARARHVEYLDTDGRWHPDPTGDVGRVQRQHVLLSLLFGRLADLPDDPGTLKSLIDVFADNTTIDAGFSRSAILDLVRWGRALDPGAITMSTLPTEPAVLADGSEVVRPAAAGSAVIADPPALITRC